CQRRGPRRCRAGGAGGDRHAGQPRHEPARRGDAVRGPRQRGGGEAGGQVMKKLLGLVFNRWVLVAVLLLAAALVIWIVGPLVAIAELRPLETESSRWIAMGVVAGLVVAIMAWKQWRARRGNAA